MNLFMLRIVFKCYNKLCLSYSYNIIVQLEWFILFIAIYSRTYNKQHKYWTIKFIYFRIHTLTSYHPLTQKSFLIICFSIFLLVNSYTFRLLYFLGFFAFDPFFFILLQSLYWSSLSSFKEIHRASYRFLFIFILNILLFDEYI